MCVESATTAQGGAGAGMELTQVVCDDHNHSLINFYSLRLYFNIDRVKVKCLVGLTAGKKYQTILY